MIVRAADDAAETADLGRHAAPIVWVAATLCAIVLCMLDLASLLGASVSTSSFGLFSLAKLAISIDAVGANLLTGYLFTCFWMLSRDGYTWPCAFWCLAQLLVGNLALCIYVVRALYTTNGDWSAFWCGPRTRTSMDKVHRCL
ncbi:hypothetical protein SPRG_08238 [Saprolegnia parasitica CBS 223.65]|uniref:Uncharacterized protein n=1 Tax=Saprolegnia parasitica (strain CBS 223.65) TaxID=695850 RepID=A0A067CB69_SAPPC|nr:hypothetical protein SPRG_08238 [Saprolegnia parasitica CBS 223.65]KDO26435.1 hypothetical protein SPRG_08238 [Saprolegnia parasitica CBS 223.65]|eukprot:XP_012202872.1 hypothetical protein SPRG_08238 [Saprolegnia parasitica CBS 223.65]